MNNKELKKVISTLSDGYKQIDIQGTDKKRWILDIDDKDLTKLEANVRFKINSSFSGMDFVAEIAMNAIEILNEYLAGNDDVTSETITDDIDETLNSWIDNMIIYTSEAERFINEYGMQNALDSYKDNFGNESVNVGALAYNLLSDSINQYIYNLMEELN